VVGEITATWVDSGIAVNKVGGDTAFSVTNLDFIKFEAVTVNAVYSTAESLQKYDYDPTNKKIFCLVDVGAADAANPTAGHVCVFRFFAIGDDADAPELT
jgi:hypothetical protein